MCRLLPVSTTIRPILLHRLDKLYPQPGKPYHRRADAGLRELPEYPTIQPRVNAPRPACLIPYPAIATSARLVAPILWKTVSSAAPTTTLDTASTPSIPASPCVVWKCPSTAVM